MLDKLLVDAASTAGAEVREATLVREVIRDGDRVVGARAVDVSGETIEARASLVIGADGLNSSVDGVEFFLRDGRDILGLPDARRPHLHLGRPRQQRLVWEHS